MMVGASGGSAGAAKKNSGTRVEQYENKRAEKES
jgi:hypothetical protein